jgi:protein-S-isoprenylcysteine O-methyltransferase Ste14
MADVVFWLGLAAGVVLIALLLATLVLPGFRLWPTPGEKTWQSYVFWPLFRGLNVLCFVTAALEWSARSGAASNAAWLQPPSWLRLLAALALVASIALFLYAFFKLGRDNSYGAQDGLVTGGIYQWSRNPQNAMLIVVYGCLAIAAGTSATMLLAGAMMAVYHLMVLCEEPWLAGVYGEPYARYCATVPRYFNWAKALSRSS